MLITPLTRVVELYSPTIVVEPICDDKPVVGTFSWFIGVKYGLDEAVVVTRFFLASPKSYVVRFSLFMFFNEAYLAPNYG